MHDLFMKQSVFFLKGNPRSPATKIHEYLKKATKNANQKGTYDFGGMDSSLKGQLGVPLTVYYHGICRVL